MIRKLPQLKAELKRKNKAINRMRLVFWCMAGLMLIILLRSAYLQLYQNDRFDKLALIRDDQLKSLPVQKGTIKTKDGEILALSRPVFSIYADPSEIKDRQTAAKQINDIIPISEAKIAALLETPGKFVWIKRFVDNWQKEAIAELGLRGVSYVRDFERIYPAQNYLANIIGFSGKAGQGLEGIEYKFDEHLSDNLPANDLGDWLYGPAVLGTSGGSIILTIKDNYQHIVEQELAAKVEEDKAASGIVMVMESKTGAILAAASYPAQNPNIYGLYPEHNSVNDFVGKIYEPGSTFKIITVAIALDHTVIDVQDKFDCFMGAHDFFGQKITDTSALGISDLTTIIKKSSNICAAQIGLLIPKQDFYQGIKKFGFLAKSGIALPGEVSGQLHPLDSWRKIDQAILSYGHGIAATPLQVMAAINTIANDGFYITPYIIDRLLDSEGKERKLDRKSPTKAISKNTAKAIKNYMTAVVSKEGTGRSAVIKGIKIAGKTGTTRKFDPALNRYSEEDFTLSFIGFLPADDPQLTIITIINEPSKKADRLPGVTPLFRKVALRILNLAEPMVAKSVELESSPHFIF